MSGSSFAYASGRVSSLEDTLLSRRVWQQLLSAEDRAEVLRILGETWYGALLQGNTDVEKALKTAVFTAEDELIEFSGEASFTKGILLRRDVRNGRYIWKNIATGGDGNVETEPQGTIPVVKLKRAWEDPAEADGLPEAFKRCIEELDSLSSPSAAELDTVLDRLAAAVEVENLGTLSGPLGSLPAVKIELGNFLTAARCRNMEITQTTLEEMLLRGGYHSPQEIAEAYRTKKLAAVLGERNGFEEVSSALEEGIETGSFLRYQKESDVVMLELLERAAASIFSPGPLVAYVLRRELEASHLKLLTAGKTAGIDPGRLMARIPRG